METACRYRLDSLDHVVINEKAASKGVAYCCTVTSLQSSVYQDLVSSGIAAADCMGDELYVSDTALREWHG